MRRSFICARCCRKGITYILLEFDSRWNVPLRHTFTPWKEKVTILQLKLECTTTTDSISLPDLVSSMQDANRPIFLKMDVEGMERLVLQEAASFLKKRIVSGKLPAVPITDTKMRM